jgi:hypothetical protein
MAAGQGGAMRGYMTETLTSGLKLALELGHPRGQTRFDFRRSRTRRWRVDTRKSLENTPGARGLSGTLSINKRTVRANNLLPWLCGCDIFRMPGLSWTSS